MASNPLSINPAFLNQSFKSITLAGADLFLDKIRYIFNFCIAAGASSSLYNLYQCYQFSLHPALHLGSNLKPIQSEMRLREIQEKLQKEDSGNVSALLTECEILLPDLNSSQKQQKILLNLVQLCVKKDVGAAYNLAKKLRSFRNLFKAAKAIKEANKDLSFKLYQQAFEMLKNYNELSPKDKSKFLLAFARAFHSLNFADKKEEALALAIASAKQQEKGVARAKSYLAIAKTWKKVGDQKKCKEFLSQAQKIFKETGYSNVCQTSLRLASAFYDCKMYQEALKEFNQLYNFRCYELDEKIINLLLFAQLAEKILSNDKIQKEFSYDAKNFIDLRFDQVKQFSNNSNKFRGYLKIACVYQNLKQQEKAEQALNFALDILETKNSDDLLQEDLIKFTNELEKTSTETTNRLFQLLRNWYDQDPSLDKDEVAIAILNLCNKNQMQQKSDEFFEEYFEDLKKQEADLSHKINHLTRAARLSSKQKPNQGFSQEQHKRMLKAAEDLISKIPTSNYAKMVATIAEEYLNVDLQKCRELFNQYGRHRAFEHLRIAAITAIATGTAYISPRAGVGISLVFCIGHTFRLL